MVNTFLPYASFYRSADVLDRQRLGRQRVEVLIILRALYGGRGYQNHPAVEMWRKKEVALASYGLYMCDEWIARGYEDNVAEEICDFFPFSQRSDLKMSPKLLLSLGELPWWFGWYAFHESHRSNLLRKNPEWYGRRIRGERINNGPFRRVILPSLPYVWPSHERKIYKVQHAKTSIYHSSPHPAAAKRQNRGVK
jgi:pyrimidine dimer DNA glycosylase